MNRERKRLKREIEIEKTNMGEIFDTGPHRNPNELQQPKCTKMGSLEPLASCSELGEEVFSQEKQISNVQN